MSILPRMDDHPCAHGKNRSFECQNWLNGGRTGVRPTHFNAHGKDVPRNGGASFLCGKSRFADGGASMHAWKSRCAHGPASSRASTLLRKRASCSSAVRSVIPSTSAWASRRRSNGSLCKGG